MIDGPDSDLENISDDLEYISDTDPIPSEEGISSEAPTDDEPDSPEEITSDPK